MVVGDERMAGGHVGDVLDLLGLQAEIVVELGGCGDDGLDDRVVLGAREEVDAVVRRRRRADRCARWRRASRPSWREAPGPARPTAQRVQHAAVDRLRQVEEDCTRPQHHVGIDAFGAAIGTAGDDRGAGNVLGVRDLELAGHVGAGGDARDRGLGDVGVEGGQRSGLVVAGERRSRGERDQRCNSENGAPDAREHEVSRKCCVHVKSSATPLRGHGALAGVLRAASAQADGDAIDASLGVDHGKLDEAASVRLPGDLALRRLRM